MPILTSLAFLLLLAGAYLLSLRVFVWDAALYLVAGIGCLTVIWLRRSPRRGRVLVTLREVVPRSPAGWIRVAALALSTFVAFAARARPVESDFTVLLILWFVALGGFALSLAAPLGARRLWGLRLAKPERWGLVALVIGAGLLRGVAVGWAPANLGGDEGTQLVSALDLVAAPLGNPFATGWYSVPTMSFLVYGIGMRLFGATIAGGRMASVIAGTLTVLTTFLLARSVGGRRVGWVAAVALAGAAYHIHFSRLASNQIGDPLIGTVTLWLVWRALGLGREVEGDGLERQPEDSRPERIDDPQASLERGAGPRSGQPRGRFLREQQDSLGGKARGEHDARPHDTAPALWGLAGISAGLGWYGYFGARWVVVLVVLVVAWRVWADRTLLRRHWAGLRVFAAGWLVTVVPLLGWYSLHGSSLTERYRAVSIFASGWLSREIAATGRSTLQLMLQQIWRSVTAFHLTPDPTFWYRPDRPLVDFVSGALIVAGLAATVVRARWPSRTFVHVWLWPTLLMAWGVTENPPSSQRGLLLIVPVVLLIAYGVEWLWSLLGQRTVAFASLAAVTLTMVVAVNAAFYFGRYVPSQVYGNPTAQSATAFARYSLAHPEPVCDAAPDGLCRGRVYFVGPPFLYWGFGTLEFMLRGFPGEDVPQGKVPVTLSGPARFAVMPERAADLGLIRERYPGGVETELNAPDGRLLMVVYDVDQP